MVEVDHDFGLVGLVVVEVDHELIVVIQGLKPVVTSSSAFFHRALFTGEKTFLHALLDSKMLFTTISANERKLFYDAEINHDHPADHHHHKSNILTAPG